MTIYIIHVPITLQAIKFNEEHSHGSLVALAIAIIAIFAAVNFNKVHFTLCIYIVHVHESKNIVSCAILKDVHVHVHGYIDPVCGLKIFFQLQIYGLVSGYIKRNDR